MHFCIFHNLISVHINAVFYMDFDGCEEYSTENLYDAWIPFQLHDSVQCGIVQNSAHLGVIATQQMLLLPNACVV